MATKTRARKRCGTCRSEALGVRDLFAAAALAGIMANPESYRDDESSGPAAWQWAFQLADAMMQQRQCTPSYVCEHGYVVNPQD